MSGSGEMLRAAQGNVGSGAAVSGGRGLGRQAWVRALEKSARVARGTVPPLPLLIEALAERQGDAPALLSDGRSMSYRALGDALQAYAGWALAERLGPGDTIGLFMPNAPDYVAVWLGLTRVGVTVALINTQLVGEALVHAIRAAGCRHVIVGTELWEIYVSSGVARAGEVTAWVHGERGEGNGEQGRSLLAALPQDAASRFRELAWPAPALRDRALFIYTSGTTGLPKAANVSHGRLLQWTHWFAGLMDVAPSDRMYNCLPLYHSVGGVVAVGATLVGGGSVVIRSGFSASRFWSEVVSWECTLFQYIGELCRYLVESPPSPDESRHRLRLCCGNGLAPEVWAPFRDRFRIPSLLEFYAATEGSFSLYNCEEEPGSIGRIPPFLAHRFPVELVRFEPETGEPVRDAEGRCIPCGPDEPGEAIGRIAEVPGGEGGRFEGYADPMATARKILRDVFAPGDTWYRTGDIMRRDPRGFFYFVDRIGETFRWKGENVATLEVAATIKRCPGVVDAVVYGVRMPGMEGRAGMAAVAVAPSFDLAVYRDHVIRRLPRYARPLFLRICPEIPKTPTFKPQTQALARAGFDPAAGGAVYLDCRESEAMVPLGGELYRRIQVGEIRL